MFKFNMTSHMKNDRMERAFKIAEKVGWGEEIVLTTEDKRPGYKGSFIKLTDSGVCFVTNANNDLVTCFLPTESQVKRYEEFAGKKLNSRIWAKIVKNQRFYKEFNET